MTTSLKFSGSLDVTLAAALAVGAAAIVFIIYRAETNGMSLRARCLLPTLRAAAIGLVILLLAGPVLESTRRLGELGQVTFIIDHSASMNHVDASRGVSRSDRVMRLLQGETGLLTSLQQTHDTVVLTSPEASPSTSLAAFISQAMLDSASTASEQASQRTVVLISDGQDNSGATPLAPAKSLADSGAAIVTWGFGDTTEPSDLAIVRIEHPDRVNATGRIRGAVFYKAAGHSAEKQVEIRIRDVQGQVVWKATQSAADTTYGQIDFEFPIEALVTDQTPQSAQLQRDILRLQLTAEIAAVSLQESSPTEVDSANNQMKFAFLAVAKDYRVLIVDGRSRWETRYLKNLFARDPQWKATTVIFSSEGQPEPLPCQSATELFEYDLVCLGEVPPDKIDPQFLLWLTDYVARGGGLILIDGQRDHLKTLLAEEPQLVPVRWVGNSKAVYADRVFPTSVGATTAWLSLGETAESNRQVWQHLPAPQAMRLVNPADDAETLVEADLGMQKYPLVVNRAFGGGRIVYFASDETWRWRYKRGDEIHSRFWNQLALALAQPPLAIGNEFAELDVDKAEYQSGQSAQVRVRLRSQDGTYKNDANVEATVYRDGNPVESFALRNDGRLPGMYSATSSELQPGNYTVKFTAADYGQVAEQLTADFNVIPPENREQLNLRQNQSLLQEIAQAGNGTYFEEADVQDLERYLQQRTAGRIELSRLSLWDSYYWFIPVIGLLATEWWLRKRWGLP